MVLGPPEAGWARRWFFAAFWFHLLVLVIHQWFTVLVRLPVYLLWFGVVLGWALSKFWPRFGLAVGAPFVGLIRAVMVTEAPTRPLFLYSWELVRRSGVER